MNIKKIGMGVLGAFVILLGGAYLSKVSYSKVYS